MGGFTYLPFPKESFYFSFYNISRKLYPEETEIFERWKKRIEIYNAGFWSIPYNFNKIIQFWNTEDPFTRKQRRETLYSCITLLNDFLTYGHCHKWIMYVMEMVFSPEIYAVMRLLLATDERTEEEISVPTTKTEIKAEKDLCKSPERSRSSP